MSARLLPVDEVVARTALTLAEIDEMERAGNFPQRRRITARSVGWLESELNAWMEALPNLEKKTGFVYFIQAGKKGLVKIGYAGDVAKRLAGLQTGQPKTLRVLATIPGDIALERQIHRQFVSSHVRGEWFSPSKPLLEFIASLEVAREPADA